MSAPTVVLLHGLARSARSMAGLARHLRRAGYETWSRSYPSRRVGIADAARDIEEAIARELPDRALVAVTHSLGGILARHLRIPLRGVLMLAPPNQGSALARIVGGAAPLRWFYGPALEELRAGAWPPPTAPCAVIAGTRARGLNPTGWLTSGARLLAPPHDGTVTVEETRLPGLVGFATVPASHTFIMDHPAARALVLRFLETGRLG